MDSVICAAQEVVELAKSKTNNKWALHEDLVKAINKLQVEAEGPAHYVLRMRHQPAEHVCTLLAIESGVLRTLVANESRPLSAQELSEKTGTDVLFITRFMRPLCAINVFDEVAPATYKSNSVSAFLNMPGQAEGTRLVANFVLPIGSKITNQLRANEFHQFPSKAKGEKTPFEWTHSMTMWEMFRSKPEHKEIYDSYMGTQRDKLRPSWYEIYPVTSKLENQSSQDSHDQPLLVDVGGGRGHDTQRFKSHFPQIEGRCVVEDLPETLGCARQGPNSVEFVPYDFFKPQPVQGARLYLFKRVCHDFSDEECQKFLSNTVKAMDRNSTLLIDDWVLPDCNAPIAGATEDIMMMMMLSGMERSESQWAVLLNSVGLEIVKIWRSEGAGESVIEAKLVK